MLDFNKTAAQLSPVSEPEPLAPERPTPTPRQVQIIPFGKYRGQPVEVLRADPSYVDWLMSQDWVRERHQPIYQIIVNNFGEAADSPEHNKLQAGLLKDDFCLGLLMLWSEEISKKIREATSGTIERLKNGGQGAS